MAEEQPTRILLLEDNVNFLETLTDLLRDHGYEVTAVSRSDEAIRLASSQDFDLLITDIRMEGLDGLQALEKVKEDQPSIQGMVMSGYCDDHEAARAERLGVHEILSKPFRAEVFLQAMQLRGAWNRNNPRLLSKQPGKRDLSGCRRFRSAMLPSRAIRA